MFKLTKISQLSTLLIFVLLLSGCDFKDMGGELKKLDDKVGESLDKLQKKQQEEVINFLDKDAKKEMEKKDLSKEQKEKIDKWIEENNLNRYGDPADTMYIGGTPLFDEATGESIGRYNYILNKHPNLLDELN